MNELTEGCEIVALIKSSDLSSWEWESSRNLTWCRRRYCRAWFQSQGYWIGPGKSPLHARNLKFGRSVVVIACPLCPRKSAFFGLLGHNERSLHPPDCLVFCMRFIWLDTYCKVGASRIILQSCAKVTGDTLYPRQAFRRPTPSECTGWYNYCRCKGRSIRFSAISVAVLNSVMVSKILAYDSEKETHPKCIDDLNGPRADTTINVCRVLGETTASSVDGKVNTVVSSWEACLNQGRRADIDEENEGQRQDETKKKHLSVCDWLQGLVLNLYPWDTWTWWPKVASADKINVPET